jgi:hypothetical protein
MAEIYDWDIVADNNNSAPPDGAPENMNYQEVNDTIREIMAVLARFLKATGGAITTAGSSNAYTLTSGQSIGAYAAGQVFTFTADRTSTGAVTLNIDGVGASNLLDARGQQAGSGDIVSGVVYSVVRRSSDFQLISSLTSAGLLALVRDTLNKSYTTGGASNAFTITTGFSLTALTTGMLFCVTPDRANTGAATLNVDGIGAVAWEDAESTPLVANDIETGVQCLVCYNGTEFRTIAGVPTPIGQGGTGGITAAEALTNLITGASQVTAAAGDLIPIADVSDSNNGKKVAASTVGAGKQTIWVPASAMKASGPSTVDITATGTDIVALAFDATNEEFAYFSIAMPKSWNEGTITFQAYWSHPATATNFGVAWRLISLAFGDDDSLTVGSGFGDTTVTDTGGTTSDLYISDESTAQTIGGTPAENDLVMFRLSRNPSNGSDTMAVDAYLIGVKILYTTDANTDI